MAGTPKTRARKNLIKAGNVGNVPEVETPEEVEAIFAMLPKEALTTAIPNELFELAIKRCYEGLYAYVTVIVQKGETARSIDFRTRYNYTKLVLEHKLGMPVQKQLVLGANIVSPEEQLERAKLSPDTMKRLEEHGVYSKERVEELVAEAEARQREKFMTPEIIQEAVLAERKERMAAAKKKRTVKRKAPAKKAPKKKK